MITARERQLLSWIEENPLISQQELAKRGGITRSSVAVHISNLMKKGYIQGKGYILQKSPYVAVVGAVNMDIFGRPGAPLIPHDSNPGQVRMSLGGVGRNIAHNLRLLDVDVKMVTALGNDLYASQVAASCRELDIDISHSLTVEDGATSTYLFITDEEGDMEMAISDMEIYEKLTPAFLETQADLFNNASLCVIDGNLPEKSILWMAEHCTSPIFVDTVSITKARKFRQVLGKLHTLKPNRIEAELLSGISITDERSLARAAAILLDTGLQRVFISLGSDGAYCAEHGGASVRLPACPGKVVNTTGAGDCFMAAVAWAWQQDFSLRQSTAAGLAAASICIAGVNTINEELSRERLLALMETDWSGRNA